MKLIDKAQEEIKKMILDKRYDSSGYLPSEGELCELLGMSRSTIREAVRSLEIRGFLQRVHGKGIRVADKGTQVMSRSLVDMIQQQQIDLDDILEVCLLYTSSGWISGTGRPSARSWSASCGTAW